MQVNRWVISKLLGSICEICNDMEIISALLALCEGNPSMIDGFPSQRASNAESIHEGNKSVTGGFSTQRDSDGVLFVVSLNNLWNKQLSCQWFLMPQNSCDVSLMQYRILMLKLNDICNRRIALCWGQWALLTCLHLMASILTCMDFQGHWLEKRFRCTC